MINIVCLNHFQCPGHCNVHPMHLMNFPSCYDPKNLVANFGHEFPEKSHYFPELGTGERGGAKAVWSYSENVSNGAAF